MTERLPAQELVTALKAAAEPTRLRILLLLALGELTVKDLTQILGQSQPRISRHLKLLSEAGLVERFRDGSWVYFHVSERTDGGRLTRRLMETVDSADPLVRRDRARADQLKRDRERAAQEYFRSHAADWDRIRTLYVPEKEVEAVMLEAIGPGPFKLLVDLGTGTGRMLELFAGRYTRGLGFDVNPSMLAYARSKLSFAELTAAELRHGDLYNLTLGDEAANVVVMHQVLHFLSDPAGAVAEAARVLAPDGQLLIVDFAPHTLEFLREAHAHERLGIPPEQVMQWLSAAGLDLVGTWDLKNTASDPSTSLTVTVYLARRPGQEATEAAHRKLEWVEEAH